MLLAARREARQQFQQGRNLSGGSEEAVKGIEHAEGVALVLRQNVVQGQRDTQEADRFRMSLFLFLSRPRREDRHGLTVTAASYRITNT